MSKSGLVVTMVGFMSCMITRPSHAAYLVSPDTSQTPQRVLLHNELLFTGAYEEGVSNRFLNDYFGTLNLGDNWQLLGGAGLSWLQQDGLALLGLSGQYILPAILASRLGVGVQHERWPDWNTSENRAVAYWIFQPLDCLSLLLGAGYRAPQYDGMSLAAAVGWPADSAEWAMLYRLEWRFLQWRTIEASVFVWDYDRMRLYTVDNIHFSLRFGVQLFPQLNVEALVGTAVSGVSGGLVSWSQNSVALGLVYDVF